MSVDGSSEARPKRGRLPWRWVVIIPLFQLAGCVGDLVSEQKVVESLLCLGSPSDTLMWTGSLVWLTLVSSLPLGLLSMGFRRLRVPYYVLLALIVPALLLQDLLVHSGTLYCDGP